MKRLGRVLVSLVVLALIAAGVVTMIRNSNGDFAGDYTLSGLFAKAGEGLPPGSEVVFRGVQIGRVSTVSLQGDMARVRVLINPTFKVPRDTTATIQPINLFGADEVSLTTPDHNTLAGPFLGANGWFAHAKNSDELGDLFAAATPLLNKIDTNNLSLLLGELAQASRGEGPSIATSIGAGTKLAGELNSTLNAQLIALDSFARFTQAVAPIAGNFNDLSTQVNAALPAFNGEVADYQKFLNSVIPFANDLTTLLTTYRPDINTILTAGDNVSRVLVAQQADIGEVVRGAYSYFSTIANGAAAQTKLPDGSTYAYFNTFILFSDVNSLVCGLLAPVSSVLPASFVSSLAPIQQALTGAGSAFDCSTQVAAFNAANPAATTAAATTPAATPAATKPATAAVQSAAKQAYGIVGAPDTSKSSGSGLSGLINSLLGGAG
jgi:phospholipid/cholesterol/gamma-HCH transport system substrate-binding protein